MPAAPQESYPGEYIQVVLSGVRPVSGVSISVTAFVGTTKLGSLQKIIIAIFLK